MNRQTRVPAACALLTAALLALASCMAYAPHPVQPQSITSPRPAPERYVIAPPGLGLEVPEDGRFGGQQPRGRFCLLSTASCTDLDPRPFTACLLGGKRCGTEGGKIEPVEEAPPVLAR